MLLNCCIVGVNPPELAKLVKNAAEDNVRSVIYLCCVLISSLSFANYLR
jgi:hypothetical protein